MLSKLELQAIIVAWYGAAEGGESSAPVGLPFCTFSLSSAEIVTAFVSFVFK